MQALRTHIDQQTRSAISDADFELVTSELRLFHLRKGHFLLQAGEVCPRVQTAGSSSSVQTLRRVWSRREGALVPS